MPPGLPGGYLRSTLHEAESLRLFNAAGLPGGSYLDATRSRDLRLFNAAGLPGGYFTLDATRSRDLRLFNAAGLPGGYLRSTLHESRVSASL